jgi:hypothetical protein
VGVAARSLGVRLRGSDVLARGVDYECIKVQKTTWKLISKEKKEEGIKSYIYSCLSEQSLTEGRITKTGVCPKA